MDELIFSAEELFHRYLKGDDDAFEGLVGLFQDELYGYINGIVRDRHEAKHLTVEAFARLAAGGAKYTGRSSLKTYLFAIAKNLSASYAKKRGRERHVSFDEIENAFSEEDYGQSGFAETQENRLLLEGALNGLKKEYGDVLRLLYYRDMSYREAGFVMRKSEKQIRLLAQRARASLKKKLTENEFIM